MDSADKSRKWLAFFMGGWLFYTFLITYIAIVLLQTTIVDVPGWPKVLLTLFEKFVEVFLVVSVLHFVFEHVLGTVREDTQKRLIAGVVAQEVDRATAAQIVHLDGVIATMRGPAAASIVTLYANKEEAYAAVADTIVRVGKFEPHRKELMLGSLHYGQRAGEPEKELRGSRKRFIEALENCVRSKGQGMWAVWELTSISNEERLGQVLARLSKLADSTGYDVGALSGLGSTRHLLPLIIGEKDLFLGFDDTVNYGIKAAMHIHGKDFTIKAREEFLILWSDNRVCRIFENGKINQTEVDRLRTSFT
jgi:hypothetical protein